MYGIRQMTMEQLFIRLLYEDWDERKYRFHLLEKDDEKNAQKGNREWFHDLELYCAAYEQREISHEEVYLENTKTLLVGHVLINTYLREHPDLSMQSKILMLNEVLYSKYENEVLGKQECIFWNIKSQVLYATTGKPYWRPYYSCNIFTKHYTKA